MEIQQQWSSLFNGNPGPDFLFQHLPVGICICDVNGSITYCNPKSQALWGNAGEIQLKKFCGSYRLNNPDGSRLLHQDSPVACCLEQGIPVEGFELIIERPDGSFVDVNANVAPFYDGSGKLLGAINCFHEITAQNTAKQALNKKSHELQEYIDNASVGLHWVDSHGIIKWANQAELDMLGYGQEEYIGRHISDFHLHADKIDDILTRLQADETLHQYESEMVCKDGSIRTVHISSNVFREDGRFIHTRCFTVDVTANKQLFFNLQESEHRYRELIESLPAALYTTDASGYISSFNQAAIDLWGREPVLGQDLWCGSWKIYRPDGTLLPLDSCPMAIALKESRPVYGEEITIERPDGSKKNVLPYPRPAYSADGQLTGGVNMLVDVTTLKQAQQQIIESEERFRVAANTAPVLIWMGETAKHRDFFNNCWLEFTGRSTEQQAGTKWMEGIHADDLQMVENTCDSAYAAKSGYEIQYRLLNHTGQYRWVHSQGRPRYTTDGEFSGYIGTVIDIHQQKLRKEVLEKIVLERTSQLQEVNKKLERSNKELEDFAYVASHDLQEPLRKISILSKMLVERHSQDLGFEGIGLITRTQAASLRMNTLIEDLLNFSKISTVHQKVSVDLHAEMQGVLMDLEAPITAKGAEIQLGELHPINGYGPQIRQLFQNLIGNALKFTHPGRPAVIRISSTLLKGGDAGFGLSGQEADKVFQLIEIKDNGIGFDQQYAQQIFEVFRRLHGRSEYAGTGIGLSIVKKVIESHHGHISAKGVVGEGATFQILLPMTES
ncbi:PAS domain S-box protein [Dyadobacter sp. CY312]|uniref:PAS domain-containing sensor histidine kinase n=1 Tax=Dyadobacter sp. CY312 TaxID=2907303 RepID=UPI001F3E8523|nr:PAS domain S-box protein [Dyadobacter sp. CY312]MCE7042893.1 PAS domain S-box protein [Dyadobacter sp. CY312]